MAAKIILVTGGNRGIGFGIVRGLAQRSFEKTIIIASRKKHDAEVAVEEAAGLGCQSRFYPLQLDVTSDKSIHAAVEEVGKEFGKLDVLINNAGVGLLENKVDSTSWRDVWTQVLNTNVTSIRLLTHAFLPLLRDSSIPAVINTSSARGSFARAAAPSMPPTASLPYSVSKAALNMLTLEMGKAEEGVKFYVVSPGHCRTGFNGFRGKREPVEGGRVVGELVEGVAKEEKTEKEQYEGGFWEFEEGQMRRVEW